MGSGKTTIGRKLANTLSLNFFDLDEMIEINQNKSIAGIFSEMGQIKFRKLEKQILDEFINKEDNFVLALGGGTPAYYDNLEIINQYSVSVYLRVDLNVLMNRLRSQKENRPLISHLDPDELPEFLAKHLFERRSFYEKSQIKIDVKEKTENELVAEIIRLLPTK